MSSHTKKSKKNTTSKNSSSKKNNSNRKKSSTSSSKSSNRKSSSNKSSTTKMNRSVKKKIIQSSSATTAVVNSINNNNNDNSSIEKQANDNNINSSEVMSDNENSISNINNNSTTISVTGNDTSSMSEAIAKEQERQQKEEDEIDNDTRIMTSTGTFDMATVEMKQRLRILEHQVKNLRSENRQLLNTRNREINLQEKKTLKYSKQIDALAQQLEQVVERNVDVLAEKEELENRAEAAEERIRILESNAGSLRALVTEYLSTPTEESKRSFHEKEFWDKVATPRLMAESMPPASYDSQNNLKQNLKNLKRGDMGYDVIRAHPIHTNELESRLAQLKATTAENLRLRRQLDKLQHENSEMHTKQKTSIKEGRELIARQQRWLMGTVRRMKWVVSQKKQLEKDLKSRSLYVGKLETKLLKQTSQIRGLRNQLKRKINSKRKKPGKKIAGKNSDSIKGGNGDTSSSPARAVVRDVRRTKSSDLVDGIVNSPRRNSTTITDQIDNIVSTNASDKSANLIRSISGVLNDKSMISSVDDLDEIMSRELSVGEIEEIEDTTSRKLQSQFMSMYEDDDDDDNNEGKKSK